MTHHKILVADDDDVWRQTVANILRNTKNFNFEVFEAKVGEDVFYLTEIHPDIACILLDYNFEKYGGKGQMNGLEIAESLGLTAPQIPIVMTSEVAERTEVAMKAGKSHLHDFIDKPFTKEALFKKLDVVLMKNNIEENKMFFPNFEDELKEAGFIAKSQAMKELSRNIIMAAMNDYYNVLLLGETGSGKTLLAEIIHKLSARKKSKFMEVNISAIPQSLFESEIFGHVKGAFSGAILNKIGILESVGEGTILFDEIADIPKEFQPRLNYILGEQRFFYRVGDTSKPIRFKGRVILATLFDPDDAPQDKQLRIDLLNRVIKIRIPPLRERKDDIPYLIKFFCEDKLNSEKTYQIEEDAINFLQRQTLTGNVAQLKKIINWSKILVNIRNENLITFHDVQRSLLDDLGSRKKLDSSTSINQHSFEDCLMNIAKYMLDNLENLTDSETKENKKGGISSLVSHLEKAIIREVLIKNNGNLHASAKFIYEQKDTFRNHLLRLRLQDKLR